MKRRKPDLLVVLALLVGLGVVGTTAFQGSVFNSELQARTIDQ